MRCFARQVTLQAWALTIVRLTLGTVFILHGGQKVLGLFGGQGLTGFIKWIGSLGVPPLLAYLAAFAEFTGGWLLLLGIASEIGALLVMAVMAGAVLVVHWPHGYFSQNGGFEYPFNLMLFALAIVVGGPGKGALWDPFRAWCKADQV
jgi:putative oxidoreductase